MIAQKKIKIIACAILYISSLFVCFLGVRHFVYKKDQQLYKAANEALEAFFNSYEHKYVIEYSGEKIKYALSKIRKFSDYKKDIIEHTYLTDNEESKYEYLWHEAYDDIHKYYSIIPRYNGDATFTGFAFRMFKSLGDGVKEYYLYPIAVGSYKQSYYSINNKSVQESVNDAFIYLSTNKKSFIYNKLHNTKIHGYDIQKEVENKYYKLEDYNTINSSCISPNERVSLEFKSLDKWNNIAGRHQKLSIYVDRKPDKYELFNPIGYYTWYDDGYNRVYLAANPINAYTIRYKYLENPMIYDLIRYCKFGFLSITILFGSILIAIFIKIK